MKSMTSKPLYIKDLEKEELPIIILMTRWHALSRCKKRLSREVGGEVAAKIQKKLTEHTISVAKILKEQDIAEIKIAMSGIGPNAANRWGKSKGLENISIQGSGKLGEKMIKELIKLQTNSGRRRIQRKAAVFIGTDLPTLSYVDLLKALKVLNHRELVIGPANDGGYWLIGLSRQLLNTFYKSPFCGIQWGSNQVLQETLRIAKTEGISYELLQEQNDLDKTHDLFPWQNNQILV